MNLGPTRAMMGNDVRLLRNMLIVFGLAVATFAVAALMIQATSPAPTQGLSEPRKIARAIH
jgi:hypothetical protein